jgi:hypothetical protein
MKYSEQNLIVENVLTEDEILEIYKILKNPNNTYLMKLFTQTVSDFDLPKNIQDKIIDYSEKISGESGLEISEYQFARYKNVVDPDSGKVLRPNLIPHRDSSFTEPRFTFDYQIGGNTAWSLVVEEKKFELKNNQALTFSGTHQVHWREPKIFSDDEYVDMVFFHLKKTNSSPYSEEVDSLMEEKTKKYLDLYNGGAYDG